MSPETGLSGAGGRPSVIGVPMMEERDCMKPYSLTERVLFVLTGMVIGAILVVFLAVLGL